MHVEDADRCIMRRDLGSRRCFAVTLQPHVVGNLRHGDGLVLILGPSRSPLYAVEIEEMTVVAMEADRNQVGFCGSRFEGKAIGAMMGAPRGG